MQKLFFIEYYISLDVLQNKIDKKIFLHTNKLKQEMELFVGDNKCFKFNFCVLGLIRFTNQLI